MTCNQCTGVRTASFPLQELATLDARFGVFKGHHQITPASRVLHSGQTWGLAIPFSDAWQKSLLCYLVPFGTVWFCFDDFRTSTPANSDVINVHFKCDMGMDLQPNLPQHPFPENPAGPGFTEVDLSIDRVHPAKSKVTTKPAPGPPPREFNWSCVLACAPTCASCIDGHLPCWVACAGGCLLSCAIASAFGL